MSSGGECGALGSTWSEERKRSYGEKYCGVNHPRYGMHHSEEAKKKMRAAAQHRPSISQETRKRLINSQRAAKGVAVVCYETGQVFDSIVEAAELLGVHESNISVAASSFPDKTCGGYHWYKAGEDIIDIVIPHAAKAPKPVFCVETNLCYPSIGEAAYALSIDARHISRACKFPTRTAGGYHWRYSNVSDST